MAVRPSPRLFRRRPAVQEGDGEVAARDRRARGRGRSVEGPVERRGDPQQRARQRPVRCATGLGRCDQQFVRNGPRRRRRLADHRLPALEIGRPRDDAGDRLLRYQSREMAARFRERRRDQEAEAIGAGGAAGPVPIEIATGPSHDLDRVDQPVVARLRRPLRAMDDGVEDHVLGGGDEAGLAANLGRSRLGEERLRHRGRADVADRLPVEVDTVPPAALVVEGEAVDEPEIARGEILVLREALVSEPANRRERGLRRDQYVAVRHPAKANVAIDGDDHRRPLEEQRRHPGLGERGDELGAVGDHVLVAQPDVAGRALHAVEKSGVGDPAAEIGVDLHEERRIGALHRIETGDAAPPFGQRGRAGVRVGLRAAWRRRACAGPIPKSRVGVMRKSWDAQSDASILSLVVPAARYPDSARQGGRTLAGRRPGASARGDCSRGPARVAGRGRGR
jgi:hypothetical protein